MEEFLRTLNDISLIEPTTGVLSAGIAACLLLLVSAFASGSEIAFFSLTPSDLNQMDEEKSSDDAKITKLRQDSERTLATILIANNLVNVAIIMLFTYFFHHIIDFADAWWVEFGFMTILLTFLLLLFGEIMPKVYARKDPLQFCRNAVPGIMFFRKLFYPIASIVVSSGKLTEKVVVKENQTLSVNELEQALELTDTEDIKEEKKILEGIVRFGDETVKEVMTSRQDVIDLDSTAPYEEVLKCVVDNNYSRIPVYQDTQDNIRGILYIKDLLPHLSKGNNFKWQSLIRPPYFVPETKKIDDLLREFQENKVHIAIVVDEFGGTSGIVTLEDILEEIVGEINDEYDEDEKNYVRINSNTFVFEGKTLLTDFYKVLKLDDETFADVEGDADTIAGLLLEIKGDFPKLHEKIDYQHFAFEILEMEECRISKVKVVIRRTNKD